jgi:dynein heavy chain
VQEAKRYNDLLEIVQSMLEDLLKALKGLVVMSEQLELIAISLFNNKIPAYWLDMSYPSLKPLGKRELIINLTICFIILLFIRHKESTVVIQMFLVISAAWYIDLKERIKFISDWQDKGIPPAFWISGFYFPQAFLTGTLQNFARKHVLSIDTIDFSFQVLSESLINRLTARRVSRHAKVSVDTQ